MNWGYAFNLKTLAAAAAAFVAVVTAGLAGVVHHLSIKPDGAKPSAPQAASLRASAPMSSIVVDGSLWILGEDGKYSKAVKKPQ